MQLADSYSIKESVQLHTIFYSYTQYHCIFKDIQHINDHIDQHLIKREKYTAPYF